jgi:hypothetical protein
MSFFLDTTTSSAIDGRRIGVRAGQDGGRSEALRSMVARYSVLVRVCLPALTVLAWQSAIGTLQPAWQPDQVPSDAPMRTFREPEEVFMALMDEAEGVGHEIAREFRRLSDAELMALADLAACYWAEPSQVLWDLIPEENILHANKV